MQGPARCDLSLAHQRKVERNDGRGDCSPHSHDKYYSAAFQFHVQARGGLELNCCLGVATSAVRTRAFRDVACVRAGKRLGWAWRPAALGRGHPPSRVLGSSHAGFDTGVMAWTAWWRSRLQQGGICRRRALSCLPASARYCHLCRLHLQDCLSPLPPPLQLPPGPRLPF